MQRWKNCDFSGSCGNAFRSGLSRLPDLMDLDHFLAEKNRENLIAKDWDGWKRMS
jgi:hypothetical protein